MTSSPSFGHVLLVDDDPTGIMLCTHYLKRGGFSISSASSVAQARIRLTTEGTAAFSAVVTDYRMPNEDGLTMLRHVQECDPTLAVVILTAEGEKGLVTRSLRGGAYNFLDKPVPGPVLIDAVTAAADATRRRRLLKTDAASAPALGDSQHNLIHLETAAMRNRLSVRFYPHERAGGDFTAAFSLGANRFALLLTDVSGHDLTAAYHAAYLQGIARGLFDRGAALDEVFHHLNSLLLQGWNSANSVELSLCAFGLVADLSAGTIAWRNCGMPLPSLWDLDGWPVREFPSAECPLGWFDSSEASRIWPVTQGTLQVWSDGLQDLAAALNATPLALAHRLQTDPRDVSALISQARDDVLSIRLNLTAIAPEKSAPQNALLINDTHAGSAIVDIDSLQCFYENSLKLALPEWGDEAFAGPLLCLRESLLNALDHGCGRRSDRSARVQAVWRPLNSTLTIRISDDGAGHQFDVEKHEQASAKQLIDSRKGLIFIKNLATRTIMSSSGNSITMDFAL